MKWPFCRRNGGADVAFEAYAPLEIDQGGHYFALTREAINVRSLVARVQTGAKRGSDV